jgi:hypothetical protein
VLGAPLYYSEDGGRTFRTDRWQKIHSDFHALWIDPANSDHMVLGSDGGITMTYDGGRSWDYVNNVPIGQYLRNRVRYAEAISLCVEACRITIRLVRPQRHHRHSAESATTNGSAWAAATGSMRKVDPTDPNIVYAESQDGNLLRRDLRTHESRSIRPLEENDQAPRYRFQWNSPVDHFIPPIPRRSTTGATIYSKPPTAAIPGSGWAPILLPASSGTSSRFWARVPDKDTLSRHDGVQQFPCITSLSESPLRARPGLLWVGTDDGNVQVTRDGGKTWLNVAAKIPGVRKGAYVSRVATSPHDEGVAYVAFDNHRSDDYSVYIYMTGNYGETWTRISTGIPEEAGAVHVVREDPANKNLLFAGTEFGLFVSFDRGTSWERMKNGLPTVPVDDLQIHPRDHDLILATHGRSLWIMDDITPLEEMSDNVLAADLHLFAMRPGITWHLANNKGNVGARDFLAPNPPYGVIVDYFLKTKLEGRNPVKITVTDKSGAKIREVNGTAEPGINRVAWDLRYDAPARPDGQGGPGGRGGEAPGEPGAAPPAPDAVHGPPPAGGPGLGGGGEGFGFGGGRGPLVDPGDYTITVAAAGKTESKTAPVEEDPRVTMSDEDRTQRRQALTKLYAMAHQADEARRKIVAIRTSLTTLTDAWKRPAASKVPDDVKKAADGLLAKVKEVVGTFEMEREGQLGSAGPPLKYTPPPVNQKIGRLMGSIDSYSGPPTARQMEDLNQASAELGPALASVKKLTDEDLPRFNKTMADAGTPYVSADVHPAK